MKVLVIEGASMSDECFTLDARITGEEITWNVTRLKAAAASGLFGRPWWVPMSAVPIPTERDNENIEWSKVAAISLLPDILNEPSLAIGSPTGIFCFVDGNHRLAARFKLKLPDFYTFIVPHEAERLYRIHHSEPLEPFIRRGK